ncbi:hypothetical protein COT68_01970 [bacterium (Candidatus Torokbacteria) CG09_land_8_20_14_0_10_42_11]|nr:MAG: hypothetical protein COT68_01970 [bacterium (Candidatus Torokbacteria) CG09_land_8_20_14_0_10_42_11]
MLKTKICVFLGFLILLIPSFVFAFDFDKDYLLSDSELYSCNLKTESQVQRFLNSENSCLANYTVDEDKAAGVIAGAAKEYEVSTCWILTTLQKEQSLIKSSEARSERALDYAMGFACPSGGSCDERYKGFKKQVESAAWQIRNRYLAYPENYTFQKGKKSKTEDGEYVCPKNIATAVNYNYTPVVGDGVTHGANRNFVLSWQSWRNWFSLTHPAGNLIQATGSKAVYLTIYNEAEERVEKMMITNLSVFKARGYNFSRVINVDQGEVDGYPNSSIRLTYPNGTLIRGSGPAIYVIENNRKRHIANLKVLTDLGYRISNARKISDSELASIPGGPSVQSGVKKIDGTLIRTKASPAIYILDEGKRRHIAEWNVFTANGYSWKDVKTISDAEMASYSQGSPMVLNDGLIVQAKGRPGVYAVESGRLRLVKNMETFKSLGYQWNWVKTVSAQYLDSVPKREGIE